MAGAGYHLYSTGDILTAAQLNTFIQQQTVMVFASADARTTALSGVLAEGMKTYRLDGHVYESYNGASWIADDVAAATHAATSKTTPVGADEIPLADSAATFGLKKLTLTNLAAWLSSLAQTLTNKKLSTPVEIPSVVAAAPAATQNIDLVTAGLWFFTTNTANNFVFNFRGNSGTSLNTLMAVNDVITVSIRVVNGATAYYMTSLTIDGGAVTPNWVGTAPTAGDVSARDLYTFAIWKTAAATFDVTAQMVKA